jgi:hypothetical protein
LVQALPCTQSRTQKDVVALDWATRKIKISRDLNASKAWHSSFPSFGLKLEAASERFP